MAIICEEAEDEDAAAVADEDEVINGGSRVRLYIELLREIPGSYLKEL